MSDQDQVQAVRQQVEVVLEEVPALKTTLAAAEQAHDGEKVKSSWRPEELNGWLEKLDKRT